MKVINESEIGCLKNVLCAGAHALHRNARYLIRNQFLIAVAYLSCRPLATQHQVHFTLSIGYKWKKTLVCVLVLFGSGLVIFCDVFVGIYNGRLHGHAGYSTHYFLQGCCPQVGFSFE